MKKIKSNKMLNSALGEVSGDAFRVLYFIIGNLRLHNTTRAEIERVSIAVRLGVWDDESGKQMKRQLDKITKYTDELVEKGFLVKDVIFDRSSGKRKTVYAIPEPFLEQEVNAGMQNLNEKEPKNGAIKLYNFHNKKTSITATTEHNNATSTTEATEHKDAAEVEDENLEELFGSCLIDPKDYEDDTEETAYLQDLNKRIVYARWDRESAESSSEKSSDNLPF